MAAPVETQASRQAFATLRPLCSGILELPLRHGPSPSDTSVLISLRQALRDCPQEGLRVCLEYALFPLQLLLDASVECRSRQKPMVSSDDGSSQNIYVADRIAEGVLSCIEELVLCCPLTEAPQINLLLRKLTAAAMLSPDEASEELRLGAVKCLKGLLSGLRPCGRLICTCKLISLPHGIICGSGLGLDSTSGFSPETRDEEVLESELEEGEDNCMIEYLQREHMGANIGHLLSLLLQISEVEASKGRTGSANLRTEAISTLRILLHKVGTADALAFFLPGIATRLVKSLQSSKRMNTGLSDLSIPSGAGGSSAAAEQSVRALTELLVLVLADERNQSATLERRSHQVASMGASDGNILSAEAALETIRQVSKLNASRKVKQEDVSMKSEDVLLSEQEAATANKEYQDNFRVDRNRMWLEYTSKRVCTLLALCFPALCRHPAPSVRLAVAEGAVMLISACQLTLEGFMPTLLESLLGMACDDWPHVASSAHTFLLLLMRKSGGDAGNVQIILKEIICRLFERLPKGLFSGEESAALFLCRQLLAAMFFAGPGAVSEIVFQSPASITQFVFVVVHCFSFSSSFVSPARPLSLIQRGSLGYIPGIFELSAETQHGDLPPKAISSEDSKSPPHVVTGALELQKLPRMPPWFCESMEWKHYYELASIVRLAGLSSMLEHDDARNLYQLVEELLAPLRHAPSIFQQELFNDDGFIRDGQWQRRVATSIAVLNEAFYGASGLWIYDGGFLFSDAYHPTPKSSWDPESRDECGHHLSGWDPWEKLAKSVSCESLMEPVGGILHEFIADAIWKLPLNTLLDMRNSPSLGHVLKDNLFLQQVTLEGVGILALSVGKLFEEQGYLGSVLYLLLERLGFPDYHISSTADLTLHVVSTACGYGSVRDLILASTDYIVDSLCRQLRHVDMFPNAPNMLVAVLRYTGAGQDLVSLLQEPMHSISLELEIPARQGHPGNILPMLRALVEIVKAASGESSHLLEKALVSGRKKCDHMQSSEGSDGDVVMNDVDNFLSDWKENQRHRQSIQEIVILSLDSSSPLMASRDSHKCLLALQIVEVGIAALASLEEVAKHQKEERLWIRKLAGGDDDDGITDVSEAEPPKLLPTMNRVWPHLASCLKHTIPWVLTRCAEVIANVVSSCGGDFFTRRFHKDVMPMLLSLLSQGSGSQAKSEVESQKLLPHLQRSAINAGKELAPASLVRVQEAMLKCVSEIGKNKRSSSALASSLEQLAAMVVGVACGSPALHECATQTLIALSNIDADLMWVLVADVAYGSGQQSKEALCPDLALPPVSELLPPFVGSHDEALWRQLSRKNPSFNIDGSKAWTILSKLEMFDPTS